MTALVASIPIDAPAERVWRILVDWPSTPRWMVDAISVEPVGPVEGVGARIVATTDIAGITVSDRMVVTRWEPPRLVEVRHVGWPIRGIGWFELRGNGDSIRLEWGEEVDPPLGPLGESAVRLLKPRFERLMRTSLANLRALAESRETAGRNRKGPDESSH